MTFVDNHDTYRNSDKFGGYVEQAYAFLFSSAGIPCVFWPHWTQYGTTLARQAAVRRAAGLHAACQVEVTQRSTYYESLATGLRGTLITRIGAAAPTDVPAGYYLAASGTGWSMYLSDGTQGITARRCGQVLLPEIQVIDILLPLLLHRRVGAAGGQQQKHAQQQCRQTFHHD